MNPSELSIFIFGIYVAIIGVTFAFIPNTFLKLFRFEPTKEPWIRVLGVIIAILAYYYIDASLAGATNLFWASVWGRFAVLASFMVLAVTKQSKPQIVAFGVIDAGCGVWTLLTLL